MKDLTKYERARLLGARALQISQGAPILVKLDEAQLEAINFNPIEIAKLELEKDLIPLDIVRPMPKKAS
ncbi:MAG TPA: DNA-directed RNA polymerase subunit K [Candidatus Nanoarchaeia archaeon]|nr:DNA-directed RNA polymerase subunit K [Candidatus Nanoarchaeia archaeon]